MFNNQEYPYQEYSSQNGTIPPSEPEIREPQKARRPKKAFWRKAIALVFSAAIFGSVAGGSYYGINAWLEQSQSTEASSSLQEEVAASNVSYSLLSDTADQTLDVPTIAAQGLTSVVSVTNISVQEVQSYFGQFGRNGRGQTQLQETTSCGSGVIVYADGTCLYVVTNYHVVEGATTLSVTFVDDQTYEAEVSGYDESMDIALLKVSIDEMSLDTLSQISVVTIGDSDELVVGEQVVAIGNALGYGQSVTTGIVSALDRSISTETGASTYIQTDAAINPGNSGGALFNMNGELIGINTAKVASTDVEGMGYAIPISQVLDLLGEWMA